MKIKNFVFNPFQENTFLLYDNTGECVIIDAGCYTSAEEDIITKFIADNNLKLTKLINTHTHIDHILGVDFLRKKYDAQFLAHKNDNYLLDTAVTHAKMFGLNFTNIAYPDAYLFEGDVVTFGETELYILEVPGHTRGHIAILDKNKENVFVGDVLFKGTIGRTDLAGGNYEQLIASIKDKLMTLNPDCVVYSGHGANTTIGYEKFTNNFLKD